MLTEKEKELIVSLLKAQKSMIGFMRGFAKPNREDKKELDLYDKLIKKINENK